MQSTIKKPIILILWGKVFYKTAAAGDENEYVNIQGNIPVSI